MVEAAVVTTAATREAVSDIRDTPSRLDLVASLSLDAVDTTRPRRRVDPVDVFTSENNLKTLLLWVLLEAPPQEEVLRANPFALLPDTKLAATACGRISALVIAHRARLSILYRLTGAARRWWRT